jgi:microcystin-dependent protein
MDITRREALAASVVSFLPEAKAGEQPKDSKSDTDGLVKQVKTLSEQLLFLSKTSTPVGTILPFAGSTPPECWLICNGVVLDPVKSPEYKELAELLGTTFDQENKSVRLPLMQGRTPIGAGDPVAKTEKINQTSKRKRGEYGGTEDHVLTIPEMPSHHHSVIRNSHGADNFEGNHLYGGKNREKPYDTSDTGGSQPHNNMQPYVVVNYIIKYK